MFNYFISLKEERLSKMKIFNLQYWRYAIIASGASTLAYLLGSHIPHVSGLVAAITALIAVRPTFHASAKEGFSQILAILMGAGIALLVTLIFGFSSAVVLIALLACFLLAQLLSLEGSAIGISISVLLVAGPHFDRALVETRFFGVALGSAIALLGSFWTRPGKPHERALDAILSQENQVATLLASIGYSLAQKRGEIEESSAIQWLEEAKGIERRVLEIRHEADDALKGHRWSPLVTEEDALAVISQVKIVQALVNTVLNIIRDLRVASRATEPLSASLAAHLSKALISTADVISEQSEVASENPANLVSLSKEEVASRMEDQKHVLNHLRELHDSPLLIGGSVLQDTNKIKSILTHN